MAEVANKFNLDSTYFVAFEMAHEALRRGLEQASDLNITQYRIDVYKRQVPHVAHLAAVADLGARDDDGVPRRRQLNLGEQRREHVVAHHVLGALGLGAHLLQGLLVGRHALGHLSLIHI